MFLRKRGMASTLKMKYQIFLCIFQKNSAMATLCLKEMEKFFWEGREKGLSTCQRNFPISFKPKVAIAEFFWKMQRKLWYSILGVDAVPLSLKNLLLNWSLNYFSTLLS